MFLSIWSLLKESKPTGRELHLIAMYIQNIQLIILVLFMTIFSYIIPTFSNMSLAIKHFNTLLKFLHH